MLNSVNYTEYFASQWRKGIPFRLAYLLLQVLDMALTLFAVSRGHTELNPVIGNLLHDPAMLVLLKLEIPLLIVWLVPAKYLIPGIIYFTAVTILNLKALL